MTWRDLETPVFAIDGAALFDRASSLARAAAGSRFAYSVKTLAVAEAVCLAHDAGWLVEVVSGDEWAFARGLGIDPNDLIVNGPCKSDDLLRCALHAGAIVHADSIDELIRGRSLQRADARARLGVRLGLGVTDPRWARFGLDVSDTDAALRRLADGGEGLTIGFHVHSGTNRSSLQEFVAISARAFAFASSYARYTGSTIGWLDLGGGFPDVAVSPHGAVDWQPPDLLEFVRGVHDLHAQWSGARPDLLFEPGRHLVGPFVDLYTRVESVKTVSGIQLATVDAGVNSLPFARAFAYPIELCASRDGWRGETVICGPLCMADDIICHGTVLPTLTPGDVLRIRGVGAYNVSMSYDFITPRARVCMRDGTRLTPTQRMSFQSH